MRPRPPLGGLAVALVLVGLMAGAPWLSSPSSNAPSLATTPSPWQTVGAAFPTMFPGAHLVSSAPRARSLDVGVSLPLRDSSGLDAFLQSVSDPHSPDFREYLSPAQFEQRYAPSAEQYAKVRSYFASFGLQEEPSADRLTLGLTGTPAQMGDAFHTQIADWTVGASVQYGPTEAPTLPSDLGVSGAFGLTSALDDRPSVDPAHLGALPSSGAADPRATAACATSGGGYTPCQVQAAYGDSTLLGKGDNGAGETMAVVDTYDSSEPATQLSGDLTLFDATYGLPSAPLSFLYPDRTPGNLNASGSSGWGFETALDMEWSHVMAEGAGVDVVFSPDSGYGLYQAVNFLVEFDVTQVISLSWGEPDVGAFGGVSCTYACNATTDGSYAILHPILEAAAAEGISVFAASGDCGAADGTLTASTNYPASDVAVTGVGGTVLTLSGTSYVAEQGWSGNLSGSSCNNGGGAGGGFSPQPQPWYQHGPGVVNNGLRGVPDVGTTAGSPLWVVYGASTWTVYGTSDATPQWAGLAATAAQIHGGGLGLLNPVLYALLRSSNYTSDFHEITSGNNGYAAGPGWEPISGIGTPQAASLVPALAKGQPWGPPRGFTVSLTASPAQGAAPLTVSFAASATGGTGTYPDYTFEFGDGNASTTPSAGTTYTYADPGSYVAWVVVFDSSGNSSLSAPLTVSVGTSPFVLSLSTTLPTPSVGQSVPFSATPFGGVSPYDWTFYWGDGTFQGNLSTPGTAQVAHTYHAIGVYCAYATALDNATPTPDGGTSSAVQIDVGGATGSCPSGTGGALRAVGSVLSSPTDSGVPVHFLGTGVGGAPPYAITWLFGDGSARVSASNATHAYTVTGTSPVTFDARLYVNDSASFSATLLFPVVVAPLPSVVTSATPASGSAPLSVAFSSTVVGGTGPLRYSWNFGDLSLSSGASAPTHIYNGSGSFNATLTLTDAVGKSASAYQRIVVSPGAGSLSATASGTPTSGILPLPVQFNASGSGGSGPYLFRWAFGDGAPYSSARNPTHTYNATGTYSATLRVTDTTGAAAFSFVTVKVSTAALLAHPTASPPGGLPPLTVTFHAGATGGTYPYTYDWRFTDGTSSALGDPTHTFQMLGSYAVRLFVNDSSTPVPQSFTTTVMVEAVPPFQATASAPSTTGSAPFTVNFTSSVHGGLGPYTYRWDFGDGSAGSAAPAPAHTFNRTGTFPVRFSVEDSIGEWINRTINITATPPPSGGGGALGWVLDHPLLPVLLVALGLAVLFAIIFLGRRRPRELPSYLLEQRAPAAPPTGSGYGPGPGPSPAAAPPTGHTESYAPYTGPGPAAPPAPAATTPAPTNGTDAARPDGTGQGAVPPGSDEGGATAAGAASPASVTSEVCPVCLKTTPAGSKVCAACGSAR